MHGKTTGTILSIGKQSNLSNGRGPSPTVAIVLSATRGNRPVYRRLGKEESENDEGTLAQGRRSKVAKQVPTKNSKKKN